MLPRFISIPGLVIGSVIEFLALELGGALSEADGMLADLRHFPVWLTVVGLGIWFGAWGGTVIAAIVSGFGALFAAWLEPGARARRAALPRVES